MRSPRHRHEQPVKNGILVAHGSYGGLLGVTVPVRVPGTLVAVSVHINLLTCYSTYCEDFCVQMINSE